MEKFRKALGTIAVCFLITLVACSPPISVATPPAQASPASSEKPQTTHGTQQPSSSQAPTLGIDGTATPATAPASGAGSNPEAPLTVEEFQSTVLAQGFTYINVTDFNSDTYPDSIIYQALSGDISMFFLSGSGDDSELFWYDNYAEALANADEDTFYQSFEPEDLSAPRTVRGTLGGKYFRCDLEGDTCLYISSEAGDIHAETIDALFETLNYSLD